MIKKSNSYWSRILKAVANWRKSWLIKQLHPGTRSWIWKKLRIKNRIINIDYTATENLPINDKQETSTDQQKKSSQPKNPKQNLPKTKENLKT